MSHRHTVAIWDWRSASLLMSAPSSPRALYGVAFLPPPPQPVAAAAASATDAATAPATTTTSGSGSGAGLGVRFVVCGERELRFGHALRGLRWRKAVFGASAELQTLPCVALNTDGRVITGSRRGDLHVWHGTAVWRRLRAHAGTVHCVSICAEQVRGAGFASGGADGQAILWSASYERLRTIDCNALCRHKMLDGLGRPLLLPPARGVTVSAVCWDAASERLLLGLGHNAVLRLQLTPFDEVATLITQGHGGGRIGGVCGQGGGTGGGTGGTEGGGGTAGGSTEGEGDRWCQVRCVAEHPREARFATAGDDGVLKVWSLATHAVLAARRMPSRVLAVAFSPNGGHVAVGGADGKLAVLDATPDNGGRGKTPTLRLLLTRPAWECVRTASSGAVGAGAAGGAAVGPVASDAGGGEAGASVTEAGVAAAAGAVAAGVLAVAYSPDGATLSVGCGRCVALLAVASPDGSVRRSYELLAVCHGHRGAVTHLSWSCDSVWLRSNCDARELRHWDASGSLGAAVPASDLADVPWATSLGGGGVLYGQDTAGAHGRGVGASLTCLGTCLRRVQ